MVDLTQIRSLLARCSPPLMPKRDEEGYYDLVSFRDLVIAERKRKEVFFAGLIIRQSSKASPPCRFTRI